MGGGYSTMRSTGYVLRDSCGKIVSSIQVRADGDGGAAVEVGFVSGIYNRDAVRFCSLRAARLAALALVHHGIGGLLAVEVVMWG